VRKWMGSSRPKTSGRCPYSPLGVVLQNPVFPGIQVTASVGKLAINNAAEYFQRFSIFNETYAD